MGLGMGLGASTFHTAVITHTSVKYSTTYRKRKTY